MNHIEKIKSGTLKDYLGPGIIGGFVVGLLFFIIVVVGNTWNEALAAGLVSWLFVFLLHLFGFFNEEWWKRKKKIKTLQSHYLMSLLKSGYELNNDLFYEKEIDGFQTEFHLDKKNNHFLKVYCNYQPETAEQLQKALQNLAGVEKLGWDYSIVIIQISDDIINYTNFNQNIIEFLVKNSVDGFTKSEWQETVGNELEKQAEKIKKANTKTFKIGKLKIDYTKNPEKPVANNMYN
jgi:prepilin signal peptidase PulO-like enzyme (type II secretory pathway)